MIKYHFDRGKLSEKRSFSVLYECNSRSGFLGLHPPLGFPSRSNSFAFCALHKPAQCSCSPGFTRPKIRFFTVKNGWKIKQKSLFLVKSFLYICSFFLFVCEVKRENEPKKFTIYSFVKRIKIIDCFVKPFCMFRYSSTAKEGKTRLFKRAFKPFVRKFLSTRLSKFSPNAKKF